MTILKGQDAAEASRGAIVLDMGDLRRQAQAMLAEARAESERLIAASHARIRTEAERALAEARERGHGEGLERGLREGREQGRAEALAAMRERLEGVEKAWLAAGEQLEARREDMMRQAKRGVLQLAVEMGRKVTHRVIEVDPTVIEDQLELALGLVLRPLEVTIRVHPEDAGLVDEVMPELRKRYANLKHVTTEQDAAVGRGGCVLSFGQGQVDAGIGTQLDRIVRALLPAGTSVAEGSPQATKVRSSSDTSDVEAHEALDGPTQAGDDIDPPSGA